VPQGLEAGVTARRAIGYAQALAELHGTQSRSEAIAEAQSLTRRYARRQVSWFRRYDDAQWMPAADPELADRALTAFLA
jgi:tRNA dimethylallyltransferase